MHSEQINEIATALAKAQGQMEAARKDAKNPHLNNKYATLSSIIDASREPLSTNGLAFSQILSQAEEGIILETLLMHSSGQWLQSEVLVSATNTNRGVNEAQALGSALTYYKRYALSAMLGVSIADEDDDGNNANPPKGQKAQPRKQEQPAPPPVNGGNGNGGPKDPQTLFDAVQAQTGGYYKNPPHLYQVLKAWPNFKNPVEVKIALDAAVDHAKGKDFDPATTPQFKEPEAA